MRITFLHLDAFAVSGTVRNIVSIANHLASAGLAVEIMSLYRSAEEPSFDLHEDVRIWAIHDVPSGRVGGGERQPPVGPWARIRRRVRGTARRLTPSLLIHRGDESYGRFSLRVDLKLWRAMKSLETDVLVSTRPSLNLVACRFRPEGARLVLQENLHLRAHTPALQRAILGAYPKADLLACLTRGDAAAYQEAVEGELDVVSIPPSAVLTAGQTRERPPSTEFLGVGRLSPQKGFDLLIEAFALIADRHPEWTLRIDGRGGELGRLRDLVERLGLQDRVVVPGVFDDVQDLMARSAALVLSSRFEGFGIVLIEAMDAGLPVIAFDCEHGPRELITDRHDGVLVPAGDVRALADAMHSFIEDPGGHDDLVRNARRTARSYSPEHLGERWREVLEAVAQ